MTRLRRRRAGPGRLAGLQPGPGGPKSPLLATAALALVLALVKVGGLLGGGEGASGPSVADATVAGDPVEGEGTVAALLDSLLPIPAIEPAAGPTPAPPPAASGGSVGSAGATTATGTPARPGGPAGGGDPLADVAAELERRAAALDRRERDLELREAAVVAVETRLAEQLGRLETLKKELEATAERIREKDEAELAQLVKTYEAMKAKNAAQVFDQLALEVLLPIVRRMREAKLAAVLAAMEPAKAKLVTAALAQTTPLPRLP